MNYIVPNLKYLRRISGFTQEGMADYFGRSQQLIGAWEEGRSIPNLKDLVKLSGLYHVSIDWLVREDLSMWDREVVFKNYNKVQKLLVL